MNRIFPLVLIASFILAPQILLAQDLSIDFGDDGSLATRVVQLFALITAISLIPAIAIMFTAFPFIITVLAILRQGIGLQQSPPNMLIVSLSLILTWYVMEPVFLAAWESGGQGFFSGELDVLDATKGAYVPFQDFMLARVEFETLNSLAELRGVSVASPSDVSASVLVPSFLLSEVERAFQVGFMIFLPFLIIDLVVAAVLMSMGMMMVPPAIVSLPFKLAFFAAADGWSLVAGAVVKSYF